MPPMPPLLYGPIPHRLVHVVGHAYPPEVHAAYGAVQIVCLSEVAQTIMGRFFRVAKGLDHGLGKTPAPSLVVQCMRPERRRAVTLDHRVPSVRRSALASEPRKIDHPFRHDPDWEVGSLSVLSVNAARMEAVSRPCSSVPRQKARCLPRAIRPSSINWLSRSAGDNAMPHSESAVGVSLARRYRVNRLA
jgi:hypothetical protein